jgi:hypothetical protein
MADNTQGPSQDALTLNDRLNALHQAGHGYLDPVTQVHLAQNAGSTQNMLTTADTYKTALDYSGAEPSKTISDPSLNQAPSRPQQALALLHSTMGPIPFDSTKIEDIQKSLQSNGYGIGLQPGTWNKPWQDAWSKAAYDKLTAPGTGNTDSFNLFKGILSEFNLSKSLPTAIHAIATYVHSLPSVARQIVADIGGEMGNFSNPNHLVDLFNPFISKDERAKFDAAQAGRTAAIDNALGGNATAAQLTEKERAARAVQDFGNIANLLLFKGVGGATFKAATAIKAGVATARETGMGLGEALLTKSLPEEFANTPRSTIVNSLYRAPMVEGGEGTGLITTKFFPSPIAARVAPMLERMSDEQGAYFKAKNWIGQTMRIPARAAGQVLATKSTMLGLGLLGTSAAQRALDTQPVYDATQTTPYSGILGHSLDVLSALQGASPEPLRGSSNVGQIVSKAHQAYSNILGNIGFDSVVKGALGIKLKDLIDGAGEAAVNDHFIGNKLTQYAVSHAAQMAAGDFAKANNIDRTSSDYERIIQQYEHEIINDPAATDAARESLINNKPLWTQMMRNDFIQTFGYNIRRGKLNPKDQEAFIASLKRMHEEGPYSASMTTFAPNVRNYWYGSNVIRAVEDLRSAEISNEWGQELPPYASSKPGGIAALSREHVGFAPQGEDLVKPTRYGNFVIGTEDALKAGRANAHVYTLSHDIPNEVPTIIDLNKNTSGRLVSDTLKSFARQDELGVIENPRVPNEQRTALNERINNFNKANWDALMSNPVTRNRYMQELRDKGLSEKEIQDKLVYSKKSRQAFDDGNFYPAEYTQLRKMVSRPENYTGQQIIEAYRKALKAANVLDKNQISQRVSDFTHQLMSDNNITGARYTDPKFGEQLLMRPDKLKGKLAKIPSTYQADKYLPSYLVHNNVNGPGVLGWANKDKITSGDALNMAKKYFDKLAKMGFSQDARNAESTMQFEGMTRPKTLNQIAGEGMQADKPLPKMKIYNSENKDLVALTNEMRSVLTKQYGYDLNKLTRMDPVQMASLMWRKSRDFAADAYFPKVKPEALTDAEHANVLKEIDRMDKAGYKPVIGTDIGHGYDNPRVHPDIIKQRTSLLRKAAMRLGIDPTRVSDTTVATARRMSVTDEISKVLTNQVKPIMGDNPESIYARLLQGAQSGLFRRGYLGKIVEKRAIARALEGSENMTYTQIKEAIDGARQSVERTNQRAHQIRDLSEKDMVKILTRSVDPADITSNPIQGYSVQDARKIARAVMIGYAKTPYSLTGLSKVEDFIRASGSALTKGTMSFMGKMPVAKNWKIGEGPIINTLSALPNDLFRLRDKWRFDNNPIFSYRRLTKTNLKAAAEGVPVSINPGKAMDRQGIRDEANKILERTMPDVYARQKDLEPLEKILAQNDVFDRYNPAHNMAWQAWHLAKQGLSDEQITAKLNKINTYGDRTQLERSINTIFYPFSFNKTLYRNLGGYLLDNPGKAVLADLGFNFYSQVNQNNAIGDWVNKHAPLLVELQKLNAFEHGTGLGQLGGINAPYFSEVMNMFGPQRITPANSAEAAKVLGLLIPAWGELNTLLFSPQTTSNALTWQGSAIETGKVGAWALENLRQHAADFISGHKRNYYTPMMTDQAQTQAGAKFVVAAKAQLANAISNGATWPQSPNVPQSLWGEKINASSIGQLANTIYPSYNPNAGMTIAIQKNQEAKNFVNRLQGTWRFDGYNEFQQLADSVIQKLHKTSDPASIQQAVDPIRNLAVVLAEKDGKFAKFYAKYYQSVLGPIEGFSK